MKSLREMMDLVESAQRSSYLYEGLSSAECKSLGLWESAGSEIKSSGLSQSDIDDIFRSVSGELQEGFFGKAKDAYTAVKNAWNDLKDKVQNSKPVQNVDSYYDQAAEKLKRATGGNDGVMRYVDKYRAFAKKHPIAQSFIYAALIAAAGLSGAGLGGAVVIGLFKMVDKLLQGEKFSSAAYSGAKTGALAYGAGQVGQALSGSDSVISSSGMANPDAVIQQIQSGKITDSDQLVSALKGSKNMQSVWKVLQDVAGMQGSSDADAVIQAIASR